MRLLVCGDRNWRLYDIVRDTIKDLAPDIVIQGEARGADSMARDAAKELGIGVVSFPAKWDIYGKAAGLIRNQQMLDKGKPDKVLAFHTNINMSKGTKDMVLRANREGLPVIIRV